MGAAAALPPGLHAPVTFDRASPLSSTAEIVRRAFTPLKAASIAATESIAGQPVDVAEEKFLVYVPANKPPQGYALLVYVSPWEDAKVPAGWASVLDEKGVIFASAMHSGNDTNVQFRRMPLAVIAAENLMRDYTVDPSRVMVGGLSGGSRAALRIALAFPDVFRSALMNSGSDPIGTAEIPLPPADLFRRFQENSRLYLLAGDQDLAVRNMQSAALESLQDWCVMDVHAATMWHAGHVSADQRTFSAALDALLDPAPAKHDGLAECRARVQRELEAKVQQVEALIASGDKPAARPALGELDTKFGGLAAAQSATLAAKLR